MAWLARAAWSAGLAVLAAAALVAMNLAGGQLAGALSLPAGGDARLAWDLGFVALASLCAVALVVAGARCAPGAHGLAVGALFTLAAGAIAWQAGGDFPAWFVAGVVLAQPLAAWAGTALGRRARR